jgi:hypothetical protein
MRNAKMKIIDNLKLNIFDWLIIYFSTTCTRPVREDVQNIYEKKIYTCIFEKKYKHHSLSQGIMFRFCE